MGILVASTIAGLGTPEEDGAHGLLRTTHVEEPLTWNLAQGVWLGRPQFTMRINDCVGIGMTGSPSLWKYPGARPEQPTPEVNPVQQNFRIHKILYAGELWAAGARLQEHLTAMMKQTSDIGGDSELALAWYPLDEGEAFLSPLSFNHGVRVILPGNVPDVYLSDTYRFCSTGWQNNVTTGDGSGSGEGTYVAPTVNDHFYPEIYQYGSSVSIRNFTALHRWAGGPGLGSAGSAEKAWKFPPADDVRGWYRAEQAPAVVGQPVPELADYSGRCQTLRQPTSANRPTLTTDGSLGGKKFLRFDGTNDFLGTAIDPIPLTRTEGPQQSPFDLVGDMTIYLVFRQRNSGGTQQVWLGKSVSGSTLIYRGDNTNQVNIWRGGSDFTYNRAANWSQPMPWTIWSMACAGTSVSVWENDVEVASGSSGTSGFDGLCLGSNYNNTLPAAIDVAELIVCVGSHGDTVRGQMVDYLNAEYTIF